MASQKITINMPLKLAILATGKRQRHIAAAAGIPESRLSDIVRAYGRPATADERRDLARTLKTSQASLFPGDGPLSVSA